MTAFKSMGWIKEKLSKVSKSWAKQTLIRFKNLSWTKTIISKLRSSAVPTTEWLRKVKERTIPLYTRIKGGKAGLKIKNILASSGLQSRFQSYRMHAYSSIGALGLLLAGSFGIHEYVEANTVEVFRVYVNGQSAGTVSSPKVVDEFKLAKVKEVGEQNPNVHMVVNTDEVTLKSSKAFKGKSDDQAAVANLEKLLQAHAVGVELVVDGKAVGIVKDKDTADQILDQIRYQYTSSKQDKGKVSILSATKALNPGESQVQKAEFLQDVKVNQKEIEANQILNPQDVLKKLQTGDVQPTKYTLEKGDTISGVAKKFGISRQVIYENNPWIYEDMVKAGQQLDLTVLKPTLSVKTVEKVVENQEIQYDTEYQHDDSQRAGVVETIKPGKNGLKNVTFLVTKVNGKMMDEELLGEQVLQQPVKAVVKRGTKVVKGEGSGKFTWPVLNSSMTSGFGYRWGKLHKGVDLVGNRSIQAADNGKVVYAGFKDDYGNHVIIDHMNGYRTLYGHLSQIKATVGQIIEKGEVIGIMGSTGDSTGVHLHFEIEKSGSVENPLKYLNR